MTLCWRPSRRRRAQELQWAIGLAAVERFEEGDCVSMGFWVGANRAGGSLMGTPLANEQHRERDHAEGLIAQNSVKDHLVAFVVGTL